MSAPTEQIKCSGCFNPMTIITYCDNCNNILDQCSYCTMSLYRLYCKKCRCIESVSCQISTELLCIDNDMDHAYHLAKFTCVMCDERYCQLGGICNFCHNKICYKCIRHCPDLPNNIVYCFNYDEGDVEITQLNKILINLEINDLYHYDN